MTRLSAPGLPLLMLILVGPLGCSGTKAPDEAPAAELAVPQSPGIRVETATVSPSHSEVSLSFAAEVKAIEDVQLAAPLGGYVESVSVKVGSKVKKGEVLARIDAGSRLAQREIAEAQATQADAELKRALALGDGVSEAQLLTARTQARVASANAKLMRINADRAVIRAPFDGIVAALNVDAGEVSPPSAPVARVVRIDSVKLELSVSERDITLVKVGQPVRFRTQSQPEGVEGTISQRGVASDPKSHTFTVEVEVPNPTGSLLPGMLGRSTFDRTVGENAIVIPQGWLVTERDRTGVYVNREGVAQWQDVKIAELTRDQAVIAEGLSSGDAVVISGQRSLSPGDVLIISRTGQCCTDGRVTF